MTNKDNGSVVMHFQHPDGFNPNDNIYKSCCCHTKTFTIFMGIFEIFTICFLLVAVLPDVTTRVCDKLSNETDMEEPLENFQFENLRNVTYVSYYLCHNNLTCLIWAFIQILSVNCMFYGIKTIRYYLFIPHFVFRLICIIIIGMIDGWIVYRATGDNEPDSAAYITSIVAISLLELGIIYATWIETRCAHFIKRSRETGFSISVARPIGPATISLSENPQTTEPQDRRLPPLRHNRNQYVVNETQAPRPGNPNETNQ